MSRSFDGINDYLQTSTPPVTTTPYSIALWFKASHGADYRVLASLDEGLGFDRTYMSLSSSSDTPANTPYGLVSSSVPTETFFTTTTSYSSNAWQHLLLVRAAANDHRVYLNGANKGTDTTSITPLTPDRFSIGARGDTSSGGWFAGLIAYAAVWDVALSDANAISLQATTPDNVVPGDLVAYWPLTSNSSPEPDDVGSNDLTVNGATFSSDNPTFGGGYGALVRQQDEHGGRLMHSGRTWMSRILHSRSRPRGGISIMELARWQIT
jgi:hypothetical protein